MIRPAVIIDGELVYVDAVPELHVSDPIRIVLSGALGAGELPLRRAGALPRRGFLRWVQQLTGHGR